ncbi:MAG TPA: hypothetical protein VHI75_01490 [Casimicrobiaceae bacterium]|nr:hypothetical protein [Casimicrobiaceae bacterium]
MYMNENSHRFPAVVMAAALTTAVIIGLSALAQSTVAITPGTRQVITTTVGVPQAAVVEASTAPFRVNVVATRS